MSEDITRAVEKSMGFYRLGETCDADPNTWTTPTDLWGVDSFADFLGLSPEYRISQRGVLELTAAMICLDVLAQDISKATLRLKKKVKGGAVDAEPKDNAIAEMLLLEPNRRHTWVEFIQMLVYHLGMSSNSYAYIRRRRDGVPEQIIPLMPKQVTEAVNQQSGEVFYQISAATVQEAALLGNEQIIAAERDVLHVRNRLLDGFWGQSTIAIGGRTLSLGRELLNFERVQYSTSKAERGYWVRDKQEALPQENFALMKAQIQRVLYNRAKEPIVLEDGIEYKEFGGGNIKETEILAALDKQIEMICKLWRMPPHKAMHFASIKYENLATLEMVYVRDTLIPMCELIEQRLARTLLSRDERLKFYFEFDRDEMAIADEKIRLEWIKTLVDRGVITLNEARQESGWNPRANGDVYLLPVNTVLINSRNQVVASGSADTSKKPEDDDKPDDTPSDTDKTLRLIKS